MMMMMIIPIGFWGGSLPKDTLFLLFEELDAAGIVVVIDCGGGGCGDFSDDFNLIFNRSSALNGLGLLYDTAAGANDGAGCATDGTGCIVLLIEDLSDEEDDDDDEDGGCDVMSLFCKRDCSSLDNASTLSWSFFISISVAVVAAIGVGGVSFSNINVLNMWIVELATLITPL